MKTGKPLTDADGEVRPLEYDDFRRARRGRPPLPAAERKVRVTMYLDPEIVAHFKGDGERGWQTRINAVLREAAKL